MGYGISSHSQLGRIGYEGQPQGGDFTDEAGGWERDNGEYLPANFPEGDDDSEQPPLPYLELTEEVPIEEGEGVELRDDTEQQQLLLVSRKATGNPKMLSKETRVWNKPANPNQASHLYKRVGAVMRSEGAWIGGRCTLCCDLASCICASPETVCGACGYKFHNSKNAGDCETRFKRLRASGLLRRRGGATRDGAWKGRDSAEKGALKNEVGGWSSRLAGTAGTKN